MRLFRAPTFPVVDLLPEAITSDDLRGKQADRLILRWEERRWLRGRFATEKGRTVAIALPTGSQIESGRVIYVADDWYVTMEAAAEPLLVVQPRDPQEAVLIAFEVGNLHFPLAMEEGYLSVPDDTAMVQLFNRMGVAWERRTAAFQPIGKGQPHGF
jgi:urease accessory protein UreE